MVSRSTPRLLSRLVADRRVDGDPQRAAAVLEVVEIEVEIAEDRADQARHATDGGRVGLAHGCLTSSLHRRRRGPRGVHAFGSPNFKDAEEHTGPPVRSGAVPPVLRMSTLFVRTLREDPADAEVASHRLLVRAGYIRRAAPGGFTFLPLGWIVLRNVERIVREEMIAAGFQEVHFPALLPREPYEITGPVDRVRRRRLPRQGPPRRRLHARPDARGDVHPPRQGPVQQLQGPAAEHLPDPDEVPRRAPTARRPAARPRVRDEGLVQLRPRPRRVHGQLPGPSRRLRADVPAARTCRT